MALSPEEFEKLRNTLKARQGAPSIESSKPGFIEGVTDAFKTRTANQQSALSKSIDSQQSLGSGLLQATGQGAGFLGDVAFEGVKAVTPEPVQKVVGDAVTAVAETAPVQTALQQYEGWKTQNPEAAANLEAVVDIASIFPIAKGGQIGTKAVGTATKKGVETAVDAVTKVPAAVGNKLTRIEPGVESVLRSAATPEAKVGIAEKFNKYKTQAETAIKDYSQPTPLELAGDEAAKALKILQTQLKTFGGQKSTALGSIGNKTVSNIGEFTTSLRNQLKERVGVDLKFQNGELNITPAAGRASKIAFDATDNKLISDAYKSLVSLGNKPTVQQLDDTVDALQDLLFKRKQIGAIPVNGQVESVLKNITKQLNDGVKKVAGPEYTKANSEYARVKKTFEVLNRALGEEGNKGASLMKQLFSPTGTAPRKLFERVKQETGVDLVQEATLAKFVMENIGDVRQASLLEQVLRGNVSPTPAGLVGKAFDFIVDKATDPIKKAEYILKN